jgi:hypothetical protein
MQAATQLMLPNLPRGPVPGQFPTSTWDRRPPSAPRRSSQPMLLHLCEREVAVRMRSVVLNTGHLKRLAKTRRLRRGQPSIAFLRGRGIRSSPHAMFTEIVMAAHHTCAGRTRIAADYYFAHLALPAGCSRTQEPASRNSGSAGQRAKHRIAGRLRPKTKREITRLEACLGFGPPRSRVPRT